MQFKILTGHRKSGTTLLHKLFDGHPDLNVYPVDLSLLYAFYPYWTAKNLSARELRDRFSVVVKKSTASMVGKTIGKSNREFDSEDFLREIRKKYDPIDLVEPGLIIDAISNSYCSYLELDHSKPFLMKETSQLVNIKDISSNNREFKMLQILRDPRDNFAAIKVGVVAYYQRMDEDNSESLASLLNRAKLDLELASRMIETETPNFDVVKFEDLVANTEREMRRILKFLDIEWHDTLLTPTFLGEQFYGNNHEGDAFSGVSSSNVGRWRDRINKNEACVIEAWMSDVMKYWGYQSEHCHDDQMAALAEFYAWYNSRYFYRDSFKL